MSKWLVRAILLAGVSGLWSSLAVAVPSYNATDLGQLQTGIGPLNLFSETVVDLSDTGFVAGTLFDSGSGQFVPAVWDLSKSTAPQVILGLSGNSFAQGVNNSGTVIGTGQNAANINSGFVSSIGANDTRTTQEIGALGTGGSRGFAINDQGRATGGADDGLNAQQAFVTDDLVTIQQLGILDDVGDSFARDIAETGHVVGVSGSDAALFAGGEITNLDPTSVFARSDAAALNEADEVVGFGRLFGGNDQAFYFDPVTETMNNLGSIVGDARARDINNDSQIVGTTEISSFSDATGGFLFEVEGDAEMLLINDLLNQDDAIASLANIQQAVAINDFGQILAIGTRLIEFFEEPGNEDTRIVFDTGELHAYLLTEDTGDTGGGDGVPTPEIFVEASARHADDDTGTQSLTANSGILVIEKERSFEDGDFGQFDLTRSRAEGLITNVGVPTVGAVSQSGGDTGIFIECDPFEEACKATKEATATSKVVSNLIPLFADPDAPPDSIDLDLLLNIDGILDIAWFFEDDDEGALAEAFAETSVIAKLHTEDGETVLFDGSVRLERDGADGAELTFGGDWQDFEEQGFTIEEDSFFNDVPNARLDSNDQINLVLRDDPIRKATEFVQVQTEFEDIAFLSPNETYALELEIKTRAFSEKLNDFSQLPEDFLDCFADDSCDQNDFLAVPPALFRIDHSFALANMLETVSAASGSDTEGVTFITVDENGDPLPNLTNVMAPGSGLLFFASVFGLVALRRRI